MSIARMLRSAVIVKRATSSPVEPRIILTLEATDPSAPVAPAPLKTCMEWAALYFLCCALIYILLLFLLCSFKCRKHLGPIYLRDGTGRFGGIPVSVNRTPPQVGRFFAI